MINLHHRVGFTLIELSVVLVIIGLIVGGILVGRDLINAAQVRSELTMVEKFSSATGTFLGKYSYLPGNIPGPVAGQFGLISTYTDTNGNYAKGDGIIKDYNDVYPVVLADYGENSVFWMHLYQAGYVGGQFSSSGYTIGANYPKGAFNEGIVATSAQDGHLYFFAGTNTNMVGSSGHIYELSTAGVIPPQQAYAMDVKTDDGLPSTGRIYAVTVQNSYPNDIVADTTTSGCVTSVAANTYNLSSGQPLCRLMVRAHGF